MRADIGMRSLGSNVLDGTNHGSQSGCGSVLYSTLPLGQWSSYQWSSRPSKPARTNTKTTSHASEDLRYWYTILKCISPPEMQHTPTLGHNRAHRMAPWKSVKLERRRRNRRMLKHQPRSSRGIDRQ